MGAHDSMRYTALHWAAVNGHVNIGRLLLEHGADVEAVNDRECASPAPMPSCKSCHQRESACPRACTKVGVAHRWELNGRGPSHRDAGDATPLFLAAQNGQLAVAALLIEYHANLDATAHVRMRYRHYCSSHQSASVTKPVY